MGKCVRKLAQEPPLMRHAGNTWIRGFILLWLCSGAHAHCPPDAVAPLSFTLEYALWRGWSQALIYAPSLESDCQWALIRLMKCMGVNGIASAVDPAGKAKGWSRLGLVILTSRVRRNDTDLLTNLIKKLEGLKMNVASYDWLMVTRSNKDFVFMSEILNSSSIRFDQNLVVAYPFYKYHQSEITNLNLCDDNFIYRSKQGNELSSRKHHNKGQYYNNCRHGSRGRQCTKTEHETNYYRTSERFRNLTRNRTYKRSGNIYPLYLSGLLTYNYSKPFIMTNVSRFSLLQHIHKWTKNNRFYGISDGVHLVQYFKVRVNSTLYVYYLGYWDQDGSMTNVEVPYPVEVRNFLEEEMIVGRCNFSDGVPSLEDDGPTAPASLDDVLQFLTVKLNTTTVTRYYSKLGFRTYEGAWTGLLGALMDNSVDIALEPVTAHPPRHHDMDFIFPITETMCNIYIRHQETSTVRDIFLAPFSANLVVCVVAVAVVASLALVFINRVTPALENKRQPVGYTEALIWSTGILCQQGGTWTPPNAAASVLLIVCLFFAVVTYNAYAAFITSVLSVRVASVDTVAAVLHSPNFKIGYIRNGADQMYLMSTKDAQLNAFYIRGYSNAENLVSTAEEGLARAARQDYAFFAGQRAARSTLGSLSQARGRCAVRELPVPSTKAHLAFPLPRGSPYARPILLSLLELRSGGALARLEAALVPGMPKCSPPPGFASARAADVRSALILLLTGLIAALLIGLGEYCWKNRKQILISSAKCYRRLKNLIK